MSSPAAPPKQSVPTRAEIDVEHRWRLEDLFATPEDWENAYRSTEKLVEMLAAERESFHDGVDAAALAKLLELDSRLGQALDRVYVYAHLDKDGDTRNSEAQGRSERASRLNTRASEATSWIEPQILALPRERLESFLDAAELAGWRHFLRDLIRRQEHTLSPREEKLLAMAGDVTRVPRTVFGMLNDADLTFRAVKDEDGREVELTKGRYSRFMESLDRRVRHDAWDSLTEGYEKHRNTVSALLSSSVQRDIFYARARGYESSVSAALSPNDIQLEVFHNLIRTVNDRRDVMHRYVDLRKRLLGLDELKIYDLYVPLSTAPPPQFSYDEARVMLQEGLAPLGEQYVADLTNGLAGAWVDVFECRGKRSGAYSWGAYGVHPYVLMNYQGTLDHVFTLAHEMGHALHSHYTNSSQPYHYSHYPIFLAEVASTTNEAILMDHLLRTTEEPDLRLALLNQYADQIRGTVVTQVMFAEFEHRLHEMAESGKALTSETISAEYREIFTRILGPQLVFDERAALGWARIPHFYTGYYVYQYATGYAAAIAFSRRILGGGDPERAAYLGFLKAGDSDYPIDILRSAGVDLTTSVAINDTLDLFVSLLDQIEEHVSRYGTATAKG
ncbi:MAG: oligoendopeptidase F [Gemmatimonadota bacterium]|nr:MAG: oligoendopeptidase F [Gemmatimonadota bacterium]